MFDSFGSGLTLGLATGTACLASCGPIYASYLMGEKRSGMQPLWVILKLNAGRFIAYTIFGTVIGLLGGSVPVSVRIPLALSGYILFSLYLLLTVARVRKTCTGCHAGRFLNITRSSFLLGILTGFSLCPAFLIAVTGAFESSGPLSGMFLFMGFFIGTTVYMLPFAVFGLLTQRDWITKASRMIAVVVAIYFGATGLRGLAIWITRPSVRSEYEASALETDQLGEGSEVPVFSIEDADTIYVLTDPSDPDDMGSTLMDDITLEGLPPMKLVLIGEEGWHTALGSLPPLSAVIVPGWADERYGAETEPWQDSLTSQMTAMGMRIFAVEYQPYCVERARGVQSFLERYSFRCQPDSGFSFLMLNPLACSPSECSSCDIPH